MLRGLRNVLLFWGPEINWIHGRKRNNIKIGHPAAPDWGGRGVPYEWKSQHSKRHATGPNGNRSILDATPHGNRSAGPNTNRSDLDLDTSGPNY